MSDIIDRLNQFTVGCDTIDARTIADAVAEINRLRLLNKELRMVDAPRITLELLVRLGYEMECLSTSRCAELLDESVQEFRERGWVQSRIADLVRYCVKTETDPINAANILKDFE